VDLGKLRRLMGEEGDLEEYRQSSGIELLGEVRRFVESSFMM